MWTNLLYSWIALSGLTLTGETWYASPPTRYQIKTVDEVEIVLGTAERSIATETASTPVYESDPLEYTAQIRGTNGTMETVTNALVWQLDGEMFRDNDAALTSAVPFYVATNSAVDLTGAFTNWDIASIKTKLSIAFDAFGYPIVFTNYEDRYKTLYTMKKTDRTPTNTGYEIWQGIGGSTSSYAEARGRAETNYQQVTITVDGVQQVTKGVFWSNYVFQGGSGTTNWNNEDSNLEVTTNKVFSHYDLIVTIEGNTVTNTVTNDYQATGGTITTNAGDVVHVFTGNGTFDASALPTNIKADVLIVGSGGGGGANGGGGGGGGGIVSLSSVTITSSFSVVVGNGGSGGSGTSAGSSGDDSQFGTNIAFGGGGGGGGANADPDGLDGGSGGGGGYPTSGTSTGGAATQASYGNAGGGGVLAEGAGGGGGGAGGIGLDASLITGGGGGQGQNFNITGSSLEYSGGGGGGAFSNTSVRGIALGTTGGAGGDSSHEPEVGTLERGGGGGGGGNGSWVNGAVGGSGVVIVRYDPEVVEQEVVTGLDPSGTYDGPGPPWDYSPWFVDHNTNDDSYYIAKITTNGANWPPSWKADTAGAYTGEYSTTYSTTSEFAYGVATVVRDAQYNTTTNAVMYTNTYVGPGGGGATVTSTVFYQSFLTKIGVTNDVYTATNMEHSTEYFYFPIGPTYGSSNYFSDQGLGLTSNVWNLEASSNVYFGTSGPVFFGGTLSSVPTDTETPVAMNAPNVTGFGISDYKTIIDWKFLYATNKYW